MSETAEVSDVIGDEISKAWESALAYLAAEGEDVPALLERAAANLAYWHEHPWMGPIEPPQDEATP